MTKKPQLTFTKLTPQSKPEEVRKEVVQRLRSGEYKQTTGALREQREGSPNFFDYCVLGVITDLALKAGVIKKFPRTSVLIPKVASWVGFTDCEGSFIDSLGRGQELYDLNDDGASFKKLAQIIERKPEGLVSK